MACWSPRPPARARPSSASSPCTWRWRRAASASTPPRSRRCPTRSTVTWSGGTAPAVPACSPATTASTVLRNMLYAGAATLAALGYVVLDEVHYLADRFRGAVWEEVIIHLPESVRVVALSATLSNAEEFGEWLTEV